MALCLAWVFINLCLLGRLLCALGLLIVEGLRTSCLGSLYFWWGWTFCWSWLWCLPSQSSFSWFFTEGTIWSPSTFSLHLGWLTVHLSWVLLLWGILGWLHSCSHYLGSWEGATIFCPQRGFLTSFQHQAMECFCKPGLFLRVGAYSLELLELWNSHRWLHGCLTRLGGCTRPEPFCGHCPVSFLCSIVLPALMVCVSLRGPVLATSGWGMGPIFSSTSRKVFIFLIIVGWEQSLVLHVVHFISCIVISLLKICIPWEPTSEVPVQEIAFWLK